MATKEFICYYYYKERLSDVPAAFVLQQMGYDVYLSKSNNWVYIENQGTIPNLVSTKHSLFCIIKYPNGFPLEKMHYYKSKIVKEDTDNLYFFKPEKVEQYMSNREKCEIRYNKKMENNNGC